MGWTLVVLGWFILVGLLFFFLQQLPSMHNYHVQSAEKGQPCVIEVIPEQAEFLNDEQLHLPMRQGL